MASVDDSKIVLAFQVECIKILGWGGEVVVDGGQVVAK